MIDESIDIPEMVINIMLTVYRAAVNLKTAELPMVRQESTI